MLKGTTNCKLPQKILGFEMLTKNYLLKKK